MTVLSSPNQPVNCGPKDISTDLPRMSVCNCTKASNLLDFQQTTVVLRRFPLKAHRVGSVLRRQHQHPVVAVGYEPKRDLAKREVGVVKRLTDDRRRAIAICHRQLSLP